MPFITQKDGIIESYSGVSSHRRTEYYMDDSIHLTGIVTTLLLEPGKTTIPQAIS